MTKDIYFDCETTGINPYCSEIIEAYFEVYENNTITDSYYFKSQVNEWSCEAEAIHGISVDSMLSYPKKPKAFRDLVAWLPSDFRLITYTNKNTELGTINFDVAILVNELNLLGTPNYWLENNKKMKTPISVHCLAKQCAKKNLFTPLKNTKTKRPSFKQENVYMALFNERYNAHNAKDDVKALVRIHNKLLELSNEDNTRIFGY